MGVLVRNSCHGGASFRTACGPLGTLLLDLILRSRDRNWVLGDALPLKLDPPHADGARCLLPAEQPIDSSTWICRLLARHVYSSFGWGFLVPWLLYLDTA